MPAFLAPEQGTLAAKHDDNANVYSDVADQNHGGTGAHGGSGSVVRHVVCEGEKVVHHH